MLIRFRVENHHSLRDEQELSMVASRSAAGDESLLIRPASLNEALLPAAALFRLFCGPKQNPHGAQLIFTTHDTNLLGNILGYSPLRRDQEWITEKGNDGATTLYPLTDFHPRKHENLERGYLQERYGGVPFLGDLISQDEVEQS